MLKKILLSLIYCTAITAGFAQTTDTNSTNNTLAPLLNFNFAGNKNTWSNVTPAVSYGWSNHFGFTDSFLKKIPVAYEVLLGPYIGSTIAIKDSTSYLPALMLPGNAGIEFNNYFIFGDSVRFTLAPCIGLKVISGFADTSISLVMHYVRLEASLEYKDKFKLTSQWTWGWTNSTDQSDNNFKKIFPAQPGAIQYLSLNLQTLLTNIGSSSPLYLNLTWNNFQTSSYNYLPNHRIFTIGLTSHLDLITKAAAAAASAAGHPMPHASNKNKAIVN